MDIFFDDEFRKLIPPLQPDELAELEKSLKTEGNRDPVVIWKENKLMLDGHHRYDICTNAGIPLKQANELSLPDRNAAKLWILRNQLGRRNLSIYSRSILALKLKSILEEQIKEKERLRKTIQQTKPQTLDERRPISFELWQKYLEILGNAKSKDREDAIEYILANTGTQKSASAVPDLTYFIQAGGKVKIGCSCAPEERLKEINKHLPEARLVGYCTGGRDLESALHHFLNEYLVNNEWYQLNNTIVTIIKSFVPNADFGDFIKVSAREEAANVYSISGQTLDRVKLIEAKATDEQKEALVNGTKTINQIYVAVHNDEVKANISKKTDWPTGKYRIIYADPAWQYSNDISADKFNDVELHYPSMPLAEICQLPVSSLALDNSVLFLWVTAPFLEDSFKVINAWGFKYKTCYIWDKIIKTYGHYSGVRHELVLVAVKGSCQPDVSLQPDSIFTVKKTGHSAKPEEFRHTIDSLYPHGPRIELFARTKAPGWEVWGNQI